MENLSEIDNPMVQNPNSPANSLAAQLYQGIRDSIPSMWISTTPTPKYFFPSFCLLPIINLKPTRSGMPPQENRREYEKRVASIVEQSWLHYTDDDGKDDQK